MEVTGTIKKIFETQTFGEKGFKKREVVIITNEQYPQPIIVEFFQDKCTVLDKYKVGQDVKIGINLRGREWISPIGEVKFFNTLQGWKIEALSNGEDYNASAIDTFERANDLNDSDPSDLPF